MPDTSTQAPPDLPVLEPDNPSAPASTAVEDIFGDVDHSDNASPAPSMSAGVVAPPPPPSATPGMMPLDLEEPAHGGSRKIVVFFVILAIVVLLGAGGAVLAWRFGWIAPKQAALPSDTKTTQEVVPPDDVTKLPVDSDYDGLSDAEELRLGTNPKNPDTDGDGLFDRDEIKVYKTDPLNPDTDGDGFKDGAEVSNGYDPTKKGAKLLEIPAN